MQAQRTAVTIALIGALMLTVATATASAGVTLIDPSGAPAAAVFRDWAAKSYVPTPDVTVTVDPDVSECASLRACASPDVSDRIWIDLKQIDPVWQRRTFMMELGVIFDNVVMTDAYRAGFRKIVGLAPDHPWWDAPDAAEGQFAEAYQLCARHHRYLGTGSPSFFLGFSYFPTPRNQARVCKLIWRAWRASPYGH